MIASTPSYGQSNPSPPTPNELRKQQLQTQQAHLHQKQAAIKELMGKCTSLATSLLQLEENSLFERKVDIQGEHPNIISVKASAGCPPNRYRFEIASTATPSSLIGLSNPFQSLGEDPSSIILQDIPTLDGLSEGFCIINSKKINVSRNDSLASMIEQIQQATGIRIAYNAPENLLTLEHNVPLRLGTPGDRSNFLKLLGIWGKGGQNSINTAPLIKIDFNKPLQQLPLASPLAASGKFCINSIEFSYDAASESFFKISESIQNSPAQAVLSYEQASKTFKLENRMKGGLDIYIEDLEGNFIEALGLSQGTFNLGNSSQIKINQQSYQGASDTLEPIDHGIQDLYLTIHDEGTVSVTISVDTQGPKEKIENALIKPYNDLQSFFQAKGAPIKQGEKRTPGLLGDNDFSRFNDTLRRSISGLSGGLEHVGSLAYLHQIGISFTDKTLSLKNPIAFEDQLKQKPQDVQKLLKALGSSLRSYLEEQTKATKEGATGGLLYTKHEAVSRDINVLKAEIEKVNTLIESENDKQKADAFTVSMHQRRMKQGASLFPTTSLF
jgi:flagellar capping protein FliD